MNRRFQLLAFVLRHLFPSSPKMIIAKGKVYAPFTSADERKPMRERYTSIEKDLHVTVEYELVLQFK